MTFGPPPIFFFFLFFILLVVLVLALALGPVQPASDIVSHVLIPLLVGNLGRRGRTPAGTAEKDDILLWLRLGKGEFPLKVSGVEMVVQSLLELGQGQVDRRGN